MPRGDDAKLRRRNRKKAEAEGVTDMFGTGDEDDDAGGDRAPTNEDLNDAAAAAEGDMPKKKKKGKSKPPGAAPAIPPGAGGGGGGNTGGIKTLPLIFLVLMVGTTLLPALIYMGDYAAVFLSKNNIMGSIGFRLGIGAVPKKRVLSFYEKHNPEKLDEVPGILAKHYGEYPKLIKKLERKYQDYGYFVGWEDDEAPIRIAMEQLQATYDVWLQQYWNKYAPQPLKTAFRNIRYNLTFLYKQFKKAWKKQIWPLLEPIFGVPDGAAAQKRKDAAEARARLQKKSGSGGGGRRRNTDFRDDDED